MHARIAVSRLALGSAVLAVLAQVACGHDPARPTSPLAPATAGSQPSPAAQATPPPIEPGEDSLEGRYKLTLEIDASCAFLRPDQRVRHYGATVAPSGRPGEYVVTLDGSTFLTGPVCTGGSGRYEGIGCDQFFLFQDGGEVRFSLENNNDEAHGGHVVERTSLGTWMEIIGQARGAIDGGNLEASGEGILWYCPTPSGYPFPCSAYMSCRPGLSLKLTPS